MQLHRSNRTEALVERLTELVRRPLDDPFARECIVVQGRGMERWLAMELARRLDVWADPWFPFPRRVLELAFKAALGEGDGEAAARFEPERLAFTIAAVLAEKVASPGYEPLARYVAGGERGARLVDLSVRIAEAFDRYLVYRPDLIEAWDAGKEDGWESLLWREVTARIGLAHPPARARRFLELANAGPLRLDGFPARISLFGISTLPPRYVELFAALARLVEVHLFMLSPSREFWADVRSRREQLREARRNGGDADVLHFDVGNPLLADDGKLARDFQGILEATVDYAEDPRELSVEPGEGSMLAVLQADALALRHRGAKGGPPRLAVAEADRSIEVHACHSPMREVEVLRDRLLACFDADPTLEPRDVVVMTPAIERYAPFVEAALGGGVGGEPRIPFRVTDRAVRATDGAIAAFLRVLEAIGGRFAAPEIVDLLELAPVRSRFEIDATELELVRRWIARAGIRWGVDAEHRAEVGQPADAQNTWQFGFERLFVGYATCGEDEGRLFAGRLPFDGVEGTEAATLGRLSDFVETLARFRTDFARAHSVAEWAARLLELVAATIHAPGGDELVRLRSAIRAVGDAAASAGFDMAIPLRAIRERVAATLDLDLPSTGFLAGGVTVCAMMPMRSIPFRVVCLLGMNDRDFPRAPRLPAFDRMARQPRLGDRSPRDDDRFLFLEAVLAARERLIVTYVGQSVHDNAELPPSVVVSELLDVVGESFEGADVLVRHPLQAFSAKYFTEDARADGAKLYSYSQLACEGAKALAAPERRPGERPLVVAPLAGPRAAIEIVSLADLVRFFKNPAKTFVRKRLGLDLGSDEDRLEDREPLELGNLADWKVGDRLLDCFAAERGEAAAAEILRASGELPPGVLGEISIGEVLPVAKAIAERAGALRKGSRLESYVIDGEIGGVRVTAELGDLWPSGQVIATYSKAGPRPELEAWIRHLLLCCAGIEGVEPRTCLVTQAEKNAGATTLSLRPVANAKAELESLLAIYRAGMEVPLPFVPEWSGAYWRALVRRKTTTAARTAAEAALPKPDNPYRDPYVALLHPDFVALVRSEAFAKAAEAVLEPLERYR